MFYLSKLLILASTFIPQGVSSNPRAESMIAVICSWQSLMWVLEKI